MPRPWAVRVDLYSLVAASGRIYGRMAQSLPLVDGWAPPPLFLVLELTYRCNLRCPFCYLRPQEAGRGAPLRDPVLTPAEIRSIVKQTAPWAMVLLSGGEILVRDDLPEILGVAAAKRPCHIFTNGTLIGSETAAEWVDLRIASVAVSLDGPEDVHDAMRGRGTFARASAAIRMLAAARDRRGKRFPLINLKTTITGDNVGRLSESIQIAEALGADYCTFQVLNNSTCLGGALLRESMDYCAQPPPIASFPVAVLEQQLQKIKEAASRSRVRVRILPDLPVASILRHYANRPPGGALTCASPWTVVYASPTGEVYPCLNYRIGSLREQPLRQLWNSRRYRQFRRRILQDGLFPDCRGCCDLILRNLFGGEPGNSSAEAITPGY